MSDFNDVNNPVDTGSTADDFNPVFGGLDVSRVPGTNLSLKQLFTPMAVALKTGSVSDLAKANAIRRLASLGLQTDNVTQNFDSIMANLVGDIGQHESLSPEQANRRIGQHMSDSYKLSLTSIRAARAIASGGEIDPSWIEDQKKLGYAVPDDLSSLPLPKLFQKSISDMFEGLQAWQRAAANAGKEIGKLTLLNDGTQEVTNPITDAAGSFIKEQAKRFSPLMNAFDVPEIVKQTEIAVGQQAASMTQPEFMIPTAAGMAAGLIPEIRLGRAFAAGAIVGQTTTNGEAEAGSMYLSLAADETMQEVPDKIKRAYALAYGAVAAGIETVPEMMLPGIKELLSRNLKASLVTGQAKEFLADQIKKNFGKNLAKATIAEAITEPMQQIIQNTMQNAVADETLKGGLYGLLTNQDLVFSDAEKERMIREGTIPGHTDIWQGVMSSMLSGAMSSLGLGLITGGVGSALGGFRKNGAKNVPQAVAEKPVEPIEAVLDEGFDGNSVGQDENSIPEVFHADIGLTTDFDQTGSSMVISTDPSAVSGPSSTTAISPVTQQDIELALSKHYPESVLADFTASIDNPDHQISQETIDYEAKTGFDFNTIKNDIIPNIGSPSINSDFKEALLEIGVTPKINTKLTSIILDKNSTKVVPSQPNDVVISSAKADGFGAIAWKSGDYWNAVVVDPKSVHKVSESEITKKDIANSDASTKSSLKSIKEIENQIASSEAKINDINSQISSQQDEQSLSVLNKNLESETLNLESLKSNLDIAKKDNISKSKSSVAKKSISDTRSKINEKIQTELSQTLITRQDPSIFKDGYSSIFQQLKRVGVNDEYANVVATVISTLTERSGFSAKRISDTVRIGITEDGSNHGLYARFPASILSARVDADPEVLIHEYTHAYLDFAPKSIIDRISNIYGKPVSEWTDADHERFVDDHLLYHKSEKKSEFLSKYESKDRLTIVAVFEQLKQYIVKTIRRIGRFGKSLSPNVIDFYDKLYNGEFYDTSEDFTANDKSFEEISEGVYVSKSTGEVVSFSDKNLLKAVRIFPMAEERTLESVKEDIKNGYEVPLSVLKNFIDDPEVATEYNFILTTEGMFFDIETKSEAELERLGYPPGQKERLVSEIGGFGKSSDNVFKKYIKDNFVEVMKSIKAKFGEKYIDNVLGMNGRPLDEAAKRYAMRHASDFRWAFWQSMKDKDPLYAAAIKNEAQWQEEMAIHREEMDEDSEVSDVKPSGMSLKRLEAMLWKRNSDIAAMEREIKLLKAKGSSTLEMQKSLAKKAAKQRRETSSALKALKAEKVAMVAGLKRASKLSPGKVATDYADSIDMIARMVSEDSSLEDIQRNVYDIQKLKSLISKDNYLASIDIDRLSDLSKMFPDKYTLDDINFLNQTKYTLRESGRIAFDDAVKSRFTDEVQKEIAKYFSQRKEQNKKAPIVDVEKYFESKSYKDMFTAMRDVSPELLAAVSGSYTTITEMRRSVSNKRKAARQFYMDKASENYPTPKKEKGESKDSFDARKSEVSRLRKSFAKREFDQSIYRKLTSDEVNDIANMTMDEFRGKYIVGSKDFEMLTNGKFLANVFNALYRGDTLPERMLQMFDGGDVNGFFYNLIIGRSRGWGTRVGYEQKYRRAMHDIQDQYTEILDRHNKTPESNVDRFVLNKKTGQVTVYTHSIRSKADSIVKNDPSTYTSFDRQEVMEMYAATKSDTKYRAVIYGNEIEPEHLNALVSMLDDGDMEVSNWILSKYAETVEDLRREFELSTGERFVFSDGDHSPIFRMFGEHDYSDAATQAELGSPTSRIQGTRTLGINTTHLGRKQRNVISKDSQRPIRLALVSNFFNHIDEVLRYTNSANDIRIMKAALGMDGNIKNPIAIQIQADIGKSNWDFIAERINEMEGNTAIEKRDNGITLWIRKAVNNLPVAQMGFMFINAVLQHLGALSSASKFRNPWLAVPRITGKIAKFYFDRFKMKNNMEFIKNLMKENPYLRDRRVDRSMKDLKTASLEGAEHGLDKLKRLSMWQFILVDEITTAASFEAKFEEEYNYLSKQNSKLYSGNELILKNQEAEIIARNKAKETIAKTQPDESIWATPTNYRSNNVIIQLMSPFMSAMSKVANQIVYDLPNTFKATFSGKWSKRLDMKRSALLNVGSSIIIFSFLNSMLYFVVKNMRAPTDDEWIKSITDWLVNPLGLAGKIAMSVADLANGALGNRVQEGRGDTILQSQGKKIMKAITEAGAGVRSGDAGDAIGGTIKAAAGIAGFAGVASNAVNHGVDWVRYAAENEDPVMLLMAPLGTTVPR